ncbi:hypothetical protein FPQ18DRAFT_324354 [Pyronema domesticum]|uniref:tRNA-splicing endonuclease subunit Sen34 n=1 Tax=Pyronema omphalodes (strain CBS 100304) TaxID=1076935 RepID=U4L2N2_PYROM|nr:hypothetical protein FPQ18DRAFT_324354 [Pyronema domesticum]CCX06503.1 Similar to Probable tRNA-splicing endonuclease subunit sen-34; acc. no. Q7SAK9 [Pyronema omphalodes CBS 100304]
MPLAEPVQEPFPIYAVNGTYLLFDVNVVSHVRKKHHMCGVLSGTLPQVPQQNVFLGLPLQLMVEEAALLVEKGAAYVVDDVTAHKKGLKEMMEEDKKRYMDQRNEEIMKTALEHQAALEAKKAGFIAISKDKKAKKDKEKAEKKAAKEAAENDDELLFGPTKSEPAPVAVDPTPAEASAASAVSEAPEAPEASTDTASKPVTTDNLLLHYPILNTSTFPFHSPLPESSSSSLLPRPNPSSYPLYKHLHSRGYFLSPGLRFGCQFMAYPGDSLRYHSHFIANGLGWDEEIDMIDIVGGGRLGTGVKKAWMFGGCPPKQEGDERGEEDRTRVFCVEWGGF